jgi:hypothetical protein
MGAVVPDESRQRAVPGVAAGDPGAVCTLSSCLRADGKSLSSANRNLDLEVQSEPRRLMAHLSFSSWYNRRHRRRGPLFRDALFFLWLSFTLWDASNAPRCRDRIPIRVCSLIWGSLRIDGMLVAPIQVLSLVAIIGLFQLVLLGL